MPISSSPETIASTVITLIVGGGAVKLIEVLLNRKRPSAEIDKTNADAEKTRAEAASVNISGLERMIDRLERSVDRVEIDNVNLRATIKKIEEERDVLFEWKREHKPYIDRLREEGALPQLRTEE